MKKIILAAGLLALAGAAMAADISVSIGQPGFYGRIDIGGAPQPQLIYAQPVIVQRPVRYIQRQPIYLRVPPGHSKNWSRHCASYNACGQEVYFVQDNWYRNDYAPHYRRQHMGPPRGYPQHGRPNDHRGDDRGHDRGDNRGNNHGNNHGNDHRGDNRGNDRGNEHRNDNRGNEHRGNDNRGDGRRN